MATATGSFVVRLGVRDADVVRRALEGLGNDGERALRRLDRAARVPAAGFNVLKAATGEVYDALVGLARGLHVMTRGSPGRGGMWRRTSTAGLPMCTTLVPVLEIQKVQRAGAQIDIAPLQRHDFVQQAAGEDEKANLGDRRRHLQPFRLHFIEHLADAAQFGGAQEPLALLL